MYISVKETVGYFTPLPTVAVGYTSTTIKIATKHDGRNQDTVCWPAINASGCDLHREIRTTAFLPRIRVLSLLDKGG